MRPTASDIENAQIRRDTPRQNDIGEMERNMIADYIRNQIARLEFQMEGIGPMPKDSIHLKWWRNEMKYWKHSRKFCKWMLINLERNKIFDNATES